MKASMSGYRYYFFIISVSLLFFVSCAKDYFSQPDVPFPEQTVAEEYPFLLPVDLSAYNLLASTKSGGAASGDSGFVFSQSLLDSLKTVQQEVRPGKICTQTPLKGELFCRSESLLPSVYGRSESSAGVVKARMYHLRYEDCLQNSVSEYLVTMIPQPEQVERDSSYSFLSMPGFTGSIFFSDLSGTLTGLWYVVDGRILECSAEKGENRSETSKITFYKRGNGVFAQTKSGDGEEEPEIDGGQLDECIVMVAYHDNSALAYWDLVNYFDNHGLGDLFPPTPGGGTSSGGHDKPGLELTCTLTIISRFCGGETLTCPTRYVKGSLASCTAVSSNDDSCLFLCWLGGNGSIFSNSSQISFVMDDDYTYTAVYQSIANKDCYDLAKLSRDVVLKRKIDSLLARTQAMETEQGVARRSDGSYYKMTGGTSSHIPMPQESGVTYSQIYHTHSSGYCCVSGGDLVGLFISILQKRNTNLDHFYFGVAAGGDVLTLRVKNITALNEYFAEYKGMSSTEAAEEIQRKHLAPIIEEMDEMGGSTSYRTCLESLVPYLELMGIATIYATKQNEVQAWSNAFLSGNGSLLLDNCLHN